MQKSKEPVRLRQRKLSSGLTSLYLDIYLNGERSYEYLRLYLVPEKTRADKEKNRSIMQLAEDIKAKRMVELRNGEFGFKSPRKEDTLFYPYYQAVCDAHANGESLQTMKIWRQCLLHLKAYDDNERLTFRNITPQWVQGFKDYLEKKALSQKSSNTKQYLSRNSAWLYFSKLRACLNRAYEEGVISNSPIRNIGNLKKEEVTRMYLTVEEMRKLSKTKCPNPTIRNAFLFSCLTGLRYSDIQKLTWGEVTKQGDFTRLIFKQKKTNGQEYLDISGQAANLMGERKGNEEKVFNIAQSNETNRVIQRWVKEAGINKKITFHCARHTFAVMMLDLGTDIYTVSKLLGHTQISTTQIYAKVLDKNKQAAMTNIPAIIEE